MRWGGQPVDLTPRETALLEVLLKQPQKVLSKSRLQEQLYDWSGEEPDSNVLEVLIGRLRRKLDAPGEPESLSESDSVSEGTS